MTWLCYLEMICHGRGDLQLKKLSHFINLCSSTNSPLQMLIVARERLQVRKIATEDPYWRQYYLTNTQSPIPGIPSKTYTLEVYMQGYSLPYVGFCTGKETAFDIIKAALSVDVSTESIREYILKICGYDEYLDPSNIPIQNFAFVQKKIINQRFSTPEEKTIKFEIKQRNLLYCPLETIEDELFNGNPEQVTVTYNWLTYDSLLIWLKKGKQEFLLIKKELILLHQLISHLILWDWNLPLK
jgi:hypothetical protein